MVEKDYPNLPTVVVVHNPCSCVEHLLYCQPRTGRHSCIGALWDGDAKPSLHNALATSGDLCCLCCSKVKAGSCRRATYRQHSSWLDPLHQHLLCSRGTGGFQRLNLSAVCHRDLLKNQLCHTITDSNSKILSSMVEKDYPNLPTVVVVHNPCSCVEHLLYCQPRTGRHSCIGALWDGDAKPSLHNALATSGDLCCLCCSKVKAGSCRRATYRQHSSWLDPLHQHLRQGRELLILCCSKCCGSTCMFLSALFFACSLPRNSSASETAASSQSLIQ